MFKHRTTHLLHYVQHRNYSVANEFKFEVVHKSTKSNARVGRIHTPHGIINTPTFVCVGTNGSIKGIDNVFLEQLESELMFCNTYHLMIHPGVRDITSAGGLHKYINRKSPIITDSGGFQVFSLSAKVPDEKELKGAYIRKQGTHHANLVGKITEDGVKFRSYRDGTSFHLTPESTIQSQKAFGSDIMIPLDELLPMKVSEQKLKKSFDRTHRWEIRSLNEHLKNIDSPTTGLRQAMYCVLHGGVDKELRQKSIDILLAEAFDGVSIGGSLGSNRQELNDVLKFILPRITSPTMRGSTLVDRPNHVLGIGDVESISGFIPFGVDSFDSAYPTRHSRHGSLLTFSGLSDSMLEKLLQGDFNDLSTIPQVSLLALKSAKNSQNFNTIDKSCDCYVCTSGYTVSYLHHLYKMFEPTFVTLATIHNVRFMNRMMKIYQHLILLNKI